MPEDKRKPWASVYQSLLKDGKWCPLEHEVLPVKRRGNYRTKGKKKRREGEGESKRVSGEKDNSGPVLWPNRMYLGEKNI